MSRFHRDGNDMRQRQFPLWRCNVDCRRFNGAAKFLPAASTHAA